VGHDVRKLLRLLIVPFVVVSGIACGGATAANNVSGAGVATPPPAVSGTSVSFKETEYTFSPATLTLKPGTYTITVTNVGQFPHDLHVAAAADGTELGGSTVVAAGQSAKFTVTFKAGQYTVWCAVDAHRSLGMQGTITVQ
jgi:plastocyanin